MESLYRICVSKTAELLKSHYWMCYEEDFKPFNPFSTMPSIIVDDLFTCVADISESLQVGDLHLLLTSGRLHHFKLEHMLINPEEFVSMLMHLSSSSRELHSLVLRKLCFTESHSLYKPIKRNLIGDTIECLIRMSPLLEILESCIPFNLQTVRNNEHIKVMIVNFVPETPLFNFLMVGDEFWPNNSLTVLEVYQDIRHHVDDLECMPIMKYCSALTDLNIDISRCLECMHLDEMNSGTLNTQYKLQRCFLGSENYGPVSITALHIATLTCPCMKEIDILVNDNHVIYGLRDFENLSSLLIQWESPNGGNFQLGIQMLLETMGTKLKTLHLLNFFTVDFAALASNAPALEELKVEYLSEYRGYQIPAECFKDLKHLILESTEDISVSGDTVLMLLSNCTNLTKLSLSSASCFSDSLLAKILAKNSLSNVKELVLTDCALTGEGIRLLATHLENLRVFDLSSSEIIFEEAASIVHSINGRVLIVET